MHLRQAAVSPQSDSPTLFMGESRSERNTTEILSVGSSMSSQEPPVLMGQGASTVQEALEEDLMRVNSVQ